MLNVAEPSDSMDNTPPSGPLAPSDTMLGSFSKATPGSTPPASTPLAPKKKSHLKLVVGSLLLALLLVGSGSAYWLSQQSQDIRNQASEAVYPGMKCQTKPSCKIEGWAIE